MEQALHSKSGLSEEGETEYVCIPQRILLDQFDLRKITRTLSYLYPAEQVRENLHRKEGINQLKWHATNHQSIYCEG